MSLTFSASYLALWALALFQGLLILALLRQLAELRRLIEQRGLPSEDWLPVGSGAPKFAGVDSRSSRSISLHNLDGRGAILLFLSGCEACKGLAASLRRSATDGLPPVVAFCVGGKQPCGPVVKRFDLEVPVLLESAEETAAQYRVSSFPTAVIVDEKRRIRGYGHPENIEELRYLLAHSLETPLGDRGPDRKPEPVLASGREDQ